MLKSNLIGSIALAVALAIGFAGTAVAASKSAEEKAAESKYDSDVRRARVVQIYLKSQMAVHALLDAEANYSAARAKDDEAAMHEHAAAMMVASTAATYWAAVFDKIVQAEAKKPDAKTLSSDYLALNRVAHDNLVEIVATNDLDELNKRLDTTVAGTLTKLRETVRKIYAFIEGQW